MVVIQGGDFSPQRGCVGLHGAGILMLTPYIAAPLGSVMGYDRINK